MPDDAAALQGAALAFRKTPSRAPSASPSRPPSHSHNHITRTDTGRTTATNNALLAANVASLTGSRTGNSFSSSNQLRPPSPRPPSPRTLAAAAARTSHSRSPSRPPTTQSNQSSVAQPSVSASFLAATRAASRTASQAPTPGLTPSHSGHVGRKTDSLTPAHLSAALAAGNERRRAAAVTASQSTDSLGRFSHASSSSLALDTAGIAPTSSLINMFEAKPAKPNLKPKPKPKKEGTEKTKPLKAFTPPRSVSPTKDDDADKTPKAVKTKAKPAPRPKPPPSPTAEKPEPPPVEQPAKPAKPTPQPKLKPKPARPDTASDTTIPIQALQKSSTGNTLRQHRRPLRSLNDDADVMDRPSPTPIQAPTPPRPRRDPSAASRVSVTSTANSTANSTATSSSSVARAASSVSYRRRASVSGAPTPPAPRRTATATSTATVDGLASAIMAGSLAAATAKMSPQPTASSLSSSPKRTPMLHTLRRDRSPTSDDSDHYESHYRRSHYHRDGRLRQGKLHLSHATGTAARNKHQHHHEGARRRWREAMTERQRRRYEAVWASNRGSRGFSGYRENRDTMDDEVVPNIVVRDIWRRSRLPADELGEVWDLVDDTGTGGLSKIGFVVGLWLIDQRLRGRKIPARVSDSVWASARGMQPKRR